VPGQGKREGCRWREGERKGRGQGGGAGHAGGARAPDKKGAPAAFRRAAIWCAPRPAHLRPLPAFAVPGGMYCGFGAGGLIERESPCTED
jgi:hypothetical protein